MLKPGYRLPSKLSFHPCLSYAALGGDALEALSAYLAGEDGKQIRGQGIVAATMPAFIRGIRACRELGADDDGFNEWRERWVRPDHLRIEPSHWDRVLAASA